MKSVTRMDGGRTSSGRRGRMFGSAALIGLLLPVAALAQTASTTEALTLPAIDVNAKPVNDANPATAVGSKLPLAPRETPQTVTSVTRQRIEEQKLLTLDDALRQTPGVTVEPIDGNRLNFYARGFEITNLQYDGVPTTLDDRIFVPPDLAMFERVEVLKGPAGCSTAWAGRAARSTSSAKPRKRRWRAMANCPPEAGRITGGRGTSPARSTTPAACAGVSSAPIRIATASRIGPPKSAPWAMAASPPI